LHCGRTHTHTPQTTDQSLLEQTEEVIREKIFQRTNSDVPYRVWQENLAWYTSKKDGGYIIHQNILVPNVRIKVYTLHPLLVCRVCRVCRVRVVCCE
jgi:GTPase Era involved in 16S rRNA processing